jgi:hypothetical protein
LNNCQICLSKIQDIVSTKYGSYFVSIPKQLSSSDPTKPVQEQSVLSPAFRIDRAAFQDGYSIAGEPELIS